MRYKLLPIILAFLFILNAPRAIQSQTFSSLSSEILETLQSQNPVTSTGKGIHAYDHRFADYSSSSVKNMIKALNNLEKKLYRFKDVTLPENDRINYNLLKSELDMTIFELKRTQLYRKIPQIYINEAIYGLYYMILSNHAPLSEKIVPISYRLKAVPELFAVAKSNIKKPPPILIEPSMELIESAITFYKDVNGALMKQFPERADELLKYSTLATEAMNDFSIYLSNLSSTQETPYALGKENFDYILSNQYFMNYGSDSLLKIAQSTLEELNNQYLEYQKFVDNNHQNGSDSVFVPEVFSKNDILNYYKWETEQIKLFLKTKDIISIPDNPYELKIVETPSFLRNIHTGITYQEPGLFDSVKTGYLYVRPIPDNLDRIQIESRFRFVNRRGFKSSVVNHVYPGDHLLFQALSNLDDPVRKWCTNSMFNKGWSLYVDEMMSHQGLYDDSDHGIRMQILEELRFNAAAAITEIKLHTGQLNYDEAVNNMCQTLNITTESQKDYIKSEIIEMITSPTAYSISLIGKDEFTKLYENNKSKYGNNFDLKKFNDRLLSQGSIPPVFLKDMIDLSQ